MGTWMCPNTKCAYDRQMQPKERCPLCGKMAQEFEFKVLTDLFKEKWAYKKERERAETIGRVLKRTKYCPRCGSARVFWAHGLPQMWSLWDCQNCGYRGALIIEDGKAAAKLRRDYKRRKEERNARQVKGVDFMPIVLKRVYDRAEASDGKRILVDRLWPRGVRKDKARIDEWIRDIAPSNELRKWFSHDPAKWNEFKKRYGNELEKKQEIVSKLAKECKEKKVTLLYSSKELKYNNAVALKEYLEKKP
jgi:uncharacterized protein YeaO (DUF488 family)/predicted RNA-binding Zn-ribbon protein involved in translation (DUF1610 family)